MAFTVWVFSTLFSPQTPRVAPGDAAENRSVPCASVLGQRAPPWLVWEGCGVTDPLRGPVSRRAPSPGMGRASSWVLGQR